MRRLREPSAADGLAAVDFEAVDFEAADFGAVDFEAADFVVDFLPLVPAAAVFPVAGLPAAVFLRADVPLAVLRWLPVPVLPAAEPLALEPALVLLPVR